MVNLTIENAMYTALAYVYGKSTVATCHMLISASQKSPLLLFKRYVVPTILSLMISHTWPTKAQCELVL